MLKQDSRIELERNLNETTILVVEDEPSIGEVVALYLKRAGYQVTAVRDGETALSSLARQLPDLVVLELMLPKADGYEITRWLREGDDTPIIMLTARREEADRIAGLEMDADDYVADYRLCRLPRHLVGSLPTVELGAPQPRVRLVPGYGLCVRSRMEGNKKRITHHAHDRDRAFARSRIKGSLATR